VRKRTPSNPVRGLFRGRLRATGLLLAAFALLLMGSLPLAACASSEPGEEGASEIEARAGTAGPTRLVRVAGFDQPVEVKSAPGFRRLMFVVEQPGRVMVVRRGKKVKRPFLDLTRTVRAGGEMGLLSIAFPGDYRRSGRFYVYYSARNGDIVVDERRRSSALRASPSFRREVIRIPHPDFGNHYGGQMHFLGRFLYFGTGDGGGANDPANNAQDVDSLLGKMVRIDPRRSGDRAYSVPASNPYVGRSGRDEIYSIGLRNPFRWSFVRKSGQPTRMAIADVGQSRFEEVNYPTVAGARGANFGWPSHEGTELLEGNPSIPDRTDPVLSLPHPPNCSVIGGLVVRDRRLADLRGRYVFADFCRPNLLRTRLKPGGADRVTRLGLRVPRVTSFVEDANRRVWLSSLEGPVYRLAPGG
jgi:glucose/arabinose dehydrogenase